MFLLEPEVAPDSPLHATQKQPLRKWQLLASWSCGWGFTENGGSSAWKGLRLSPKARNGSSCPLPGIHLRVPGRQNSHLNNHGWECGPVGGGLRLAEYSEEKQQMGRWHVRAIARGPERGRQRKFGDSGTR